ncbi:DNA sulfur modification protein DndB [Shewanella oncorhynchi]|uniref:DNA sulfur modification protein DndB n=1 Tax=Shewanella oncorhynchi TaxID=2726434 RepID=UPI002E7ADAE3|nr:DNA sulfur modification protein DndB [Shewanella oncorhynchi]WVI93471.1 DNA sulfur modification protein DndB [Shewanella oncorhynchi]
MDKRLVLPCLRGFIGSWTTYSCMMRLSDAGELIGFADELHQIEKLSDKIQRELNSDRAEEITNYLLENEDRFFNSLVVAVYDGDPNWHNVDNLRPNNEESRQLEFPDYAEDCIGFLSVTKKEKFFALDGQHRLAGIKGAIDRNDAIGKELINVIIVAHSNTPSGKVRSRRLFTTLNKKAKLVSKDAIIALDEDDIAACITRGLLESHEFPYLNESNISFSSGPVRDKTSITSIVNIYDNVQKLVANKLNVKISELERLRYRDYNFLFEYVRSFFELTFTNSTELSQVVQDNSRVIDYRNSVDGGYLLLRPIGWDIYTDIVISGLNTDESDMESVIKLINAKDLSLSGKILANKVWSIKQKRILNVSAKNQKIIERNLLSIK